MIFGAGREWVCSTLDVGSVSYRVQDAENPVGDERMFGTDYLVPPTWTLTLQSLADDAAAAHESFGRLAEAFTFARRRTPGAVMPLRYEVAGGEYVVYGRPRELTPDVSSGLVYGAMSVQVEFVLQEPIVYTAGSESLRLVLYPGDPTGLLSPTLAPIRWRKGPAPRQGQIVNGGHTPVPFRVEFRGPSKNPRVHSTVGGWEVQVFSTLLYDQSVVVDTRTQTVTRSDGVSLAGRVSRRSSLSARLAHGAQEVIYSADDSAGASEVTISWQTGRIGF